MTFELACKLACLCTASALLAVAIVYAVEGLIWTFRALFDAAVTMWDDPE
jgi:hypothetical protein